MKRSPILVSLVAAMLLIACSDRTALPLPGTLERDRIDLVAQAPEPVVDRPVEEGARVAKGDVLLRLDDTRAQAQLSEAQAAYDQAAARLEEAVNGPRKQDIAAARARLKGAVGNFETARREYARSEDLAKSDVRSQSALDQARAALDSARAERDAAQANLDQLLEGTRQETLAQVRAAVAQARGALAAARLDAERLTVRAPRAGIVDSLPYHLGERPPTHATVAVLLGATPVYAEFYIPEPLRASVHAGDRAEIHLDGRNQPLTGHVSFIASESAFTPYYALTERDRSRLAYRAKAVIDDAPADLPAGVPVNVDFPDLHGQ